MKKFLHSFSYVIVWCAVGWSIDYFVQQLFHVSLGMLAGSLMSMCYIITAEWIDV